MPRNKEEEIKRNKIAKIKNIYTKLSLCQFHAETG
jgi:hypothetical protein